MTCIKLGNDLHQAEAYQLPATGLACLDKLFSKSFATRQSICWPVEQVRSTSLKPCQLPLTEQTFAIVPLKENAPIPETVQWSGNLPARGAQVTLLATGKAVKWMRSGDVVTVSLPASVKKLSSYPALAFSFVIETK